ncbi:MAG: hypothetical protein HN348_07300, partial [Proteobacteria bacterium]|nr:hypothetical protein [Pseudomonadota bacterium]
MLLLFAMLSGCFCGSEPLVVVPDPVVVKAAQNLDHAILFVKPGNPLTPTLKGYLEGLNTRVEVVDQALSPHAEAYEVRDNGTIVFVA